MVPYKGKNLTGRALQQQVDKWVAYGTIEPSAGEAIKRVAANPDTYLDLVRAPPRPAPTRRPTLAVTCRRW